MAILITFTLFDYCSSSAYSKQSFFPKMCLHIIGLLIGCIFAINARIKTKRKVLDPGKAAVFDRFHSKPDVTADLTRRSSRNSFHLTTAGEETLKGWGGGIFTGDWHAAVANTAQSNRTICGSYPLLGCVASDDTSPAPRHR